MALVLYAGAIAKPRTLLLRLHLLPPSSHCRRHIGCLIRTGDGLLHWEPSRWAHSTQPVQNALMRSPSIYHMAFEHCFLQDLTSPDTDAPQWWSGLPHLHNARAANHEGLGGGALWLASPHLFVAWHPLGLLPPAAVRISRPWKSYAIWSTSLPPSFLMVNVTSASCPTSEVLETVGSQLHTFGEATSELL